MTMQQIRRSLLWVVLGVVVGIIVYRVAFHIPEPGFDQERQNKQIVREFFEAGNRGEMERCIELLADDISWTDIGTTRFSGTYVGKEALSANLLGPLFGQLKAGIYSTIENIVAEGQVVVVQSRGKAETVDGKPYNNTYCHIIRVREGKIYEVTEYFDTALTNAVFGT